MCGSYDGALEQVWQVARSGGALGADTVPALRDHANGYITRGFVLPTGAQCVDLGTGVGIPGLFLALRYPKTHWRLLDASARRCEIASEAAGVLGLAERTEIVHGRVDDLAHDPSWRFTNHLVVTRSFGPPAETAECGLPLLSFSGSLISSVSKTTADVWMSADLKPLDASIVDFWTTSFGNYIRIMRQGQGIEDRFPRRHPARLRKPLF